MQPGVRNNPPQGGQGVSLMRSLFRILAFCFLALVLSGVNYCQEDFEIGAQTTASPSPSPEDGDDGSGDTDDGDDSEDESPTPIPGASPGESSSPSPSPSADASVSPSPEPTVSTAGIRNSAQSLFAELQAATNSPENWLGESFSDEGGESNTEDDDGDGFSNRLEAEQGTDLSDGASFPSTFLRSDLAARVLVLDSDGDGLNDAEELRIGTSPSEVDSDGDGIIDGGEVLSGSDPLLKEEALRDSDSDGLPDGFEQRSGYNQSSRDSDSDGLSDLEELIVGSDPMRRDTDEDGVSDGREVAEGADPIIPETLVR